MPGDVRIRIIISANVALSSSVIMDKSLDSATSLNLRPSPVPEKSKVCMNYKGRKSKEIFPLKKIIIYLKMK